MTGIRRERRVASAILLSGAVVTAGCGGGSGGGVTGPPPGAPTLLDVQTAVFTPRCAVPGCHVGAGAPFGLDLSSAGIASASAVGIASAEAPSFLRVEPSNAADSYLYMKISGDPRILGDPMPASGGPLSDSQKTLIVSWINGGAK